MFEVIILWDWLNLAVRWLHIICAMAWIGSSFYFIALDLGLNRDIETLADGEEWQVHGGGFYHIQKYLVAPQQMPAHLTWFKWESYMTWISGATLLMIVYWSGAEFVLIDPAKMALTQIEAIAISASSIALGWIIYNQLCKSKLGNNPNALMVILFLILVLMAWGYDQIFTGRAAMIHLGAFTATIMSANVFFIIIPNQKIVVDDLIHGRIPDAKYGRIAKLRSTHNNYLTLPVVFLMLSNHYPLAFASEFNWLIASLIFLIGVTIRHFFNSLHAKKTPPYWTWIVTSILFIAIMWLSSLRPLYYRDGSDHPQRFSSAEGFEEVKEIISLRCAMCHGRDVYWSGVARAPKGVVLETANDISVAAAHIYAQAGLTYAMPPANTTGMTEAERAIIRAWYQGAKE